MKVRSTLRDLTVAAAAICVTSALLVSYIAPKADATHMPADKIAAAATSVDVIGANNTITLLREEMKLSTPTDLILQLTAECSILTGVTTLGDGTSEAQGRVAMHITIDGQTVPVQDSSFGNPEGDDNGRVVFCNRLHRQRTTGFDDTGESDNEIENFQRTRTANAFNWISINPSQWDTNGDNVLEIEVLGTFETNIVSDPGTTSQARALVGSRSLVVEPVKLAVHEQTNAGGDQTPTP